MILEKTWKWERRALGRKPPGAGQRPPREIKREGPSRHAVIAIKAEYNTLDKLYELFAKFGPVRMFHLEFHTSGHAANGEPIRGPYGLSIRPTKGYNLDCSTRRSSKSTVLIDLGKVVDFFNTYGIPLDHNIHSFSFVDPYTKHVYSVRHYRTGPKVSKIDGKSAKDTPRSMLKALVQQSPLMKEMTDFICLLYKRSVDEFFCDSEIGETPT